MNKEVRLVKKFYATKTQYEWARLNRDPFHHLEFETTMQFLKQYLPKKGLVLDAGGGPGRYTVALTKLGHDIVLFDLVKENLEFAKKQIAKAKVTHRVKKVVQGSITDLSLFPSNSFDAVVCLGGPLSHVSPNSARRRAANELIRVAKKGAPIFVSVMGKFGTLVRAPRDWPEEIVLTRHFKRFVFEGDDYRWHGGKAYAHFFERDELKKMFSKQTRFIEQVGLEGLSSANQAVINKLAKDNPRAWKNWLAIHKKICTHPTVVDMSQHFMVIVRKV